MARYIIKRVIAAVISMFFLITITFFLTRAIPGGPFSAGEQKDLNPEIVEAIRARYGLDKPVFEQYLNYLGKLLQGDMGVSYKKVNYTVDELIIGGFPASARRAHIVLPGNLQHGGSHQTGDMCDGRQTKAGHRQNKVLHLAPAGIGEQAPLHAELIHQQHGYDKGGNGNADGGDDHGRHV